MFFVLDPPMHVTYEHEVNVRHQKNWSPFDYCPKCQFNKGYVDVIGFPLRAWAGTPPSLASHPNTSATTNTLSRSIIITTTSLFLFLF